MQVRRRAICAISPLISSSMLATDAGSDSRVNSSMRCPPSKERQTKARRPLTQVPTRSSISQRRSTPPCLSRFRTKTRFTTAYMTPCPIWGQSFQSLSTRCIPARHRSRLFAPKTTKWGFRSRPARAVNFLKIKATGRQCSENASCAEIQSLAFRKLSTFHRYYSVVKDPVSALKQVASGSLTPETMEALSTVYPQTLKEMQTAVMGAMT